MAIRMEQLTMVIQQPTRVMVLPEYALWLTHLKDMQPILVDIGG